MKQTGKSLVSSPFSMLTIVLLSLLALVGLAGCGGGSSGGNKPSLSIDSPLVVEGDTDTKELIFTITLSEDADDTLTVDYTTTDDTATTADDDYTAVSGQLTIAEGSRTASVSVFVNGDDDFEQEETFNLEISNPQGIKLAENSISGVGAIENDDDAEPKGYFAGSAVVNTSTTLSDLVGIAYEDRLMVFSKTGASNVLYDIEIANVTISDYTATADVYVDGAISQTGIPVTNGTTNELQISGTLGGTGLASGTFSLDFDVDNNEAASLDRIVAVVNEEWSGQIYGQDNDSAEFRVTVSGVYEGIEDNLPKCAFQDTFPTAFLELNIYQLSHDVINISNCTYADTNYTGFATVITANSTDDTLYYAFTNGAASLFAVMSEP